MKAMETAEALAKLLGTPLQVRQGVDAGINKDLEDMGWKDSERRSDGTFTGNEYVTDY